MSKDINKILAEIEYNKKLNSANTEKVKSDYTAIIENEKLKELKNKIRLTNSIRFSGFTLYALSFLGLIASTSLSLAGGYKYYSGIALYAFVVAVVFVQLVIFKVSTFESIIRDKFNRHYFSFKLLQYGLLTVSIYFNYAFFISHMEIQSKWITLVLCILLDVSVIKFVSLAHDNRMLNYSNSENVETQSLFYMIAFNMFFRLRLKTFKAYKDNVKTLKGEVSKENVKSFEHVKTNVLKDDVKSDLLKENVLSSKTVDNTQLESSVKSSNVKSPDVKTLKDNVISLDVKTNDVKRALNIETDVKTNSVKRHLVKTYKDNDLVDVKELKDSFNLTARQWQSIKKEIPELLTKGTNTYYVELKTAKNDQF